MNIDDLLLMAGDNTLDSFDWGPSIVLWINSVAADVNKINLEMQVSEARDKMRQLPAATLVHLLQTRFDMVDGQPVARPHAPPAPLSVAVPVVDVSGQHIFSNPRQALMLLSGIGITIAALVLAVSVGMATVKTGTTQESQTLQVMSTLLGDVLKSLAEPPKEQPK